MADDVFIVNMMDHSGNSSQECGSFVLAENSEYHKLRRTQDPSLTSKQALLMPSKSTVLRVSFLDALLLAKGSWFDIGCGLYVSEEHQRLGKMWGGTQLSPPCLPDSDLPWKDPFYVT